MQNYEIFCLEYRRWLELENTADSAYAKEKMTKADMAIKARKIADMLEQGTAKIDLEGVRHTCNVLGIPHTRKAIMEFLRTTADATRNKARQRAESIISE
ncbi:MAG: hypothetical protein PHO57_03020 [Acidithiobacillus sp.]|nr:hypothetical protein [Acidithiobacillus sp.]